MSVTCLDIILFCLCHKISLVIVLYRMYSFNIKKDCLLNVREKITVSRIILNRMFFFVKFHVRLYNVLCTFVVEKYFLQIL